ncbi:MAG: site-specific DNA-methyltransferase [Ktedonobacterales bacterium]|nr:site-specific DNA-methyltransferase [Ktedonobacterales bacterium]
MADMRCDTILHGDALSVLRKLPSRSVQCCVTSPPYYAQRDYGTAVWVGGKASCSHVIMDAERTPWACEVPGPNGRRKNVAAGHWRPKYVGGHCVNCGAIRQDAQLGLEAAPAAYVDRMVAIFEEVQRVLTDDGTLWLNLGDSYAGAGYSNHKGTGGTRRDEGGKQRHTNGTGYQNKQLFGVPWLVAFALQADGWWLRSDVVWHKHGAMPDPTRDRPMKAHEYVFLFAKRARYYCDESVIRSLNTVWTIPPQQCSEHSATMPEALAGRCILAGSRPGDLVLDPFFGAGTTGVVARRHNRHYLGIELNAAYIALAEERIAAEIQPVLWSIA